MTNPSSFHSGVPLHAHHSRDTSSSSSNNSNKEHQPLTQSIIQSITKLLPPDDLNSNLSKFVTGTLAFYTSSFLSQFIQYKLKVSTGTRPTLIPMMIGATTVAVGSYMGHLSGVGVQSCWNRLHSGGNVRDAGKMGVDAVKQCVEPMRLLFERDERLSKVDRKEKKDVWVHTVGVCIIGLLSYKTILRSNFTSLSPSSFTARGSFARVGIPAPPNFSYATSSQRARLERIGRAWGCHTCGSRMLFSNMAKKDWHKPRFHGDHIPPVSVAKQLNERWYRKKMGWKVSQKFYPQCRDCSNKQGGLLSKAINAGHKNLHSVGGGGESHFHGARIRIGHMAGGIVAVATVGQGFDGKDVVIASRKRIQQIRDWAVDTGKELIDRIHNWWS